MQAYYDGDTFERGGRTFKVRFPYDDSGGAPWENDDGVGIVSEWTRRDKAPGEMLLHQDHSSKRYYDFAGTLAKAKKDGWGLSSENIAALAKTLKRKPTRKQIIAEAVRRDFERLRNWCDDRWNYVGCVVREFETGRDDSLWGIESDCEDYLAEVAHELADRINFELDAEMALAIADARPDLAPNYPDANP